MSDREQIDPVKALENIEWVLDDLVNIVNGIDGFTKPSKRQERMLGKLSVAKRYLQHSPDHRLYNDKCHCLDTTYSVEPGQTTICVNCGLPPVDGTKTKGKEAS